MYVYCFQCQTARCKAIAALMEYAGVDRAFSPLLIQREWHKGQAHEITRDLLPGYVFAYSSEPMDRLIRLRGIDGIIRQLGDAANAYQLQYEDLNFAMGLLKINGVVGVQKVFELKDEVQLLDPLFNGAKGRIAKLDRYKKRARVEFEFGGSIRSVWVACEQLTHPEAESTDEAAESARETKKSAGKTSE